MMLNPPNTETVNALYQWAVVIIPIIGFVFLGVQKYLSDATRKEEAVKVASELQTVRQETKDALDVAATQTSEKIDAVAKTTAATHAIVNGGRSNLLMQLAIQAEELAKLKGTPESVEAAHVARSNLLDHAVVMLKSNVNGPTTT